jgi:predicted DNA-binding antitoxin AbrB/MazE fold protein
MPETITAIFQDGAFVPEQETHIAPGSRVRIVIEPVQPGPTTAEEALRDHPPPTEEEWEQFNALCDRMSVNVGKEGHMTRDELHERR